MILILSKERNEATTDEVMDWLHYYGQDFERVNGEDLEDQHLRIELNGSEKWGGIMQKFAKAGVIWFRRWHNSEAFNYFEQISVSDAVRINTHFKGEISVLNSYLFGAAANATWVDHPSKSSLNKLFVLRVAKFCGLKVPDTLITNKREDVISFLSDHPQGIITKPICEVVHLEHQQHKILTHTRIIGQENIGQLPETFFPSLFQQNINKKIELRVFVLGNEVYSMAIFSQNDTQTHDDFRNYNKTRPNRFVPFRLPDHISEKVMSVMEKLKLSTGSIDLILDRDNEYYFLEVNPGGQFGMVSKPCNYYLEKKMSEHLINLTTQKP